MPKCWPAAAWQTGMESMAREEAARRGEEWREGWKEDWQEVSEKPARGRGG